MASRAGFIPALLFMDKKGMFGAIVFGFGVIIAETVQLCSDLVQLLRK
jgi:hypothetical protein